MTHTLTLPSICRSVTYILWSSDFASYLEDYLMEKRCTWDNGLLWLKDRPCKIYVGQWPIFHGPAILPYIIVRLKLFSYIKKWHPAGGIRAPVGTCSSFQMFYISNFVFGYLKLIEYNINSSFQLVAESLSYSLPQPNFNTTTGKFTVVFFFFHGMISGHVCLFYWTGQILLTLGDMENSDGVRKMINHTLDLIWYLISV